MQSAELKQMQMEIHELKREVRRIKDILAEEELTEEAAKRLEKARRTPVSEYSKL
ncbi:hypothetical protein HZB00_00885 [Candidatus Woesearchaeota archaeon]|nr:hypothetical protein [Candidatus Woesearchaeota archaeon]